jgi:hypothetical protein
VQEVHERLHLEIGTQLAALDAPLDEQPEHVAERVDHPVDEVLVQLRVAHRLGQHARDDAGQPRAGEPPPLCVREGRHVPRHGDGVGRLARRDDV